MPTRLAQALAEFGRIDKTLHSLTYIDDENRRRATLTQLNRGEGRHSLGRAVFHGKRGELRQRIDKALGQLSHEHRTVMVLHEFEEMEYKAIAKTMGCSIGTVMSRLFYARRKMAALLADLKKME